MTIFARLPFPLAAIRTVQARGAILALAVTAALSAVLLLAAAPAGAVVTKVETTEVGLTPRNVVTPLDGQLGASFANLSGNPVVHSSNLYVIYWDPTDPPAYHPEWERLIDTFVQGLGAESGSLGNVFSVDGQYTDKSNKGASYRATYEFAYTDTHKYPVTPGCTDPHPLTGGHAITCLTNAQLAEELQSFIAQRGLPEGMGSIFYLLTPPGVTVCLTGAATSCSDYTRTGTEETEGKFESPSYLNSFCSYHADLNPDKAATGDANTVLFAAIPWIAGGAGNYHLGSADRTQAYECQDGGFDPSSNPPEKREAAKERTKSQQEEYDNGNTEQKQKIVEDEAREKPHEEEPNQLVGVGEDGAYDTGLADLIINQIAVEQQNIVTNPLLNAWQDASHREVGDECRNFFASGTLAGSSAANENTLAGTLSNQAINGANYYLNDAFNLAGLRFYNFGVPCVAGVRLDPKFTAPNPVNAGETISLNGMESDITLDNGTGYSAGGSPEPAYATYTWNFGDGSHPVSGFAPGAPLCETPWLSPCAASAFHSYQYGGAYQVTLTATDVGGNTASVTHTITVNGPSQSSSSPSSSSSGGSAAPGASQAGGSSPGPVPSPTASAAILSRTLGSVMRSGLLVRYSVNEQVAGRFEVLLDRSLARRLGIGGAPAVGLPAGSSPKLVIARAILVTTTGGHGTIKIQLSKRTASRLARLRKVSLTLRLIVRNAASHSPATATVLSVVTLTR